MHVTKIAAIVTQWDCTQNETEAIFSINFRTGNNDNMLSDVVINMHEL